jgi:hypothetical protein
MSVVSQLKQYQPVNRCIYCGKTDRKLTNEHIVPYAVGGQTVLPKASCLDCSKVTSKVEQFVARQMWGEFRLLAGLPSRNKKRQSEIAYSIRSRGSSYWQKRLLAAGNHPAWLHFPRLPEPQLFTGLAFTTFNTWSAVFNQEALIRWKGKRVLTGAIDLQVFCRFLIKIAHSYACAEAGLASFSPTAVEAVFDASQSASMYVGSYQPDIKAEPDILHRQQLVDIECCGVKYRGVRIRLFANCGAPEYVVGLGACTTQASFS